ncbi:RGCVC family protein [Geodermatophilus sp. SYSU D00742]
MPAPASTATRAERPEGPSEVSSRSADDPGCDVCPHPVAGHDPIALRFCRATLTAGVDRGCVCRPA